MSDSRPNCGHCIYWKGEATSDRPLTGHCHRNPPGVFINPTSGTVVQKFPLTDRSQWCGEWSDDEAPLVEAAKRSLHKRG